MNYDFMQLIKYMKLHDGVSDEELEQFMTCSPILLPDDYLNFFKTSNGALGRIGDKYLEIWSLDKVISANEANEVDIFAPGLFLFGSDGADEAFGFDTREEPYIVVQVSFIGMDWKDSHYLASSFYSFLQRMLRGK